MKRERVKSIKATRNSKTMKPSSNLITFGVILVIVLVTVVQAQAMTEEEASKYTETLAVGQSSNQITPNMRRVIYTPITGDCPDGRKRDRRGRCRTIFV